MTSSLSFCITAAGRAARVRALLELLRPHADEIVLGVDRDGDADTLEACADLADRRLVYKRPDSPARLVGWILNECSCDWVLRLDDDEVPSAALLDSLPALIASRHQTHFRVPRRWLFQDAGQYISSFPWEPDHQTRLVRNVPSLWRFEGVLHDEGTYTGVGRLLDQPIYHCDLVVNDLARRRKKFRRYESVRPGVELYGFPVNAMYLPEYCTGVSVARVPAEDRSLITALLTSSRHAPAAPARAKVVAVEDHKINRFNTTRETSPRTYRAELSFAAPSMTMPTGSVRECRLAVTNLGDSFWPAGEDQEPRIRVGCKWYHADSGEPADENQPRTFFTEPVRPGDTTEVLLCCSAPAAPGEYVLTADVVHEDVRWFDCAVRLPIEVRTAEPVWRSTPLMRVTTSAPQRLADSWAALSRRFGGNRAAGP